MFEYLTLAQLFEAIMMICFGISWPISIVKTIRTKNPKGKSLVFTMLVIIGYLSGVMYKICGTPDFVIGFYLLNTVSASIDLILCRYYINKIKKQTA